MKLSNTGSANAAKRQFEVDCISVFEAYAATLSDAREPVSDALEAAREDRGWDALACEDIDWDALVLGAGRDDAQEVADSDAIAEVCSFEELNVAILGWARDHIECNFIEHAIGEPADYLGRRVRRQDRRPHRRGRVAS
jgi:hypothetical protein